MKHLGKHVSLALAAFLVVGPVFGTVTVCYVKPQASGSGSGESWDDACTLAVALGKAVSGDEIHLASGTYACSGTEAYSVAAAVALRGGFAAASGTDDALGGGERSVLDGQNQAETLLVLSGDSGTVTLERLTLKLAKTRGLMKTGAANLSMSHCEIVSNNVSSAVVYGRGCCLKDDTRTAEIDIRDCTFVGQQVTGANVGGNSGAALYVKGAKSLTVADTDFVLNGLGRAEKSGRDGGTYGGAVYVADAPTSMTRCDFLGNGVLLHNNNGGMAVYLSGASAPSAFTNCAFVANFGRPWMNQTPALNTTRASGALCISFDSAEGSASVENCTFAYNLATAPDGYPNLNAGLQVVKGTVAVHNTAFFGNLVRNLSDAAADICATTATATVSADYCQFAVDASGSGQSAYLKGVVLSNALFVEPEMAASFADFTAYVTAELHPVIPTVDAVGTPFAKNGFESLDVHPRSSVGRWNGVDHSAKDAVHSQLIDAGDPMSFYEVEPLPNGGRLNIGAYGNTHEASLSATSAVPKIGSVEVDVTCDYTQPHFKVVAAGDGVYRADVRICTGLSDGETSSGGWEYELLFASGVQNGQTLDVFPRRYFARNDVVYWRIELVVNGTVEDVAFGTVEVYLDPPAWIGCGGDPSAIVHCRLNATGSGSGEDWANAAASLEEALELVTEAKRTVWVCGDWTNRASCAVIRVNSPIEIVGGFSGIENAVGERSASRRTVIDGDKSFSCLYFDGSATLVLRNFALTRSKDLPALVKTGTGDVVLDNLHVFDNGYADWCLTGRGVRLEGGGTAWITNCVFEGNCFRGVDNGVSDGAALWLAGLSRAYVDDCRFVTNGLAQAGGGGSRTGCRGVALYAVGTPVTVRGCRFIGNRATAFTTTGGPIVALDKNCQQSAFSNCLWVANEVVPWTTLDTSGLGAMLAVLTATDGEPRHVDVENCTLAYNLVTCKDGSGAVRLASGATMKIRNSILWGNVCRDYDGCVSEIMAADADQVDVDYTLLDGTTADYVTGDGRVCLGDHVLVGDPYFVTPSSVMQSAVNDAGFVWPKSPATVRFVAGENFDALLSANLHVRGKGYVDERTGLLVRDYRLPEGVSASPAVDGGERRPAGLREPIPNGGYVNLGFYGNTPWATFSRSTEFLIILK